MQQPFLAFQAVELGVAKEFQPAIDEFFQKASTWLLVGKEKTRLPYHPPALFVNCKFWRLATEDGQEVKEIFTEHSIQPFSNLPFQKAWLLANGLALPDMVTSQKNEFLDYLMYGKLAQLPLTEPRNLAEEKTQTLRGIQQSIRDNDAKKAHAKAQQLLLAQQKALDMARDYHQYLIDNPLERAFQCILGPETMKFRDELKLELEKMGFEVETRYNQFEITYKTKSCILL